ncbi:asparaginase [Bosea eneae]|uniref:Asparaginase n=1 Tax=Bosea eneae TaxID=151454 RepID=A0ABW0IW81_9HYPH
MRRDRSRVAVIGTGGTISAIGRDAFDLHDYDAHGVMLDAAELLARCPRAESDPDRYAVPFGTVSSVRIGFEEWRHLAILCHDIADRDPDLAGIVIAHGTATLEETAFFLHLVLKIEVPVVVTGAMRPWNGLSSDAAANLRDAIRVAAVPEARGLGVMVVMNGEIHAARDVTKTSTTRLDAFRSPTAGPLGEMSADRILFRRRPWSEPAGDPLFAIDAIPALPRVDILHAYAGGDGALARAAIAAGARGIVSAGFAPGETHPEEVAALRAAAKNGVVIVQSTHAGSGRVPPAAHLAENGFIGAEDLPPHKARILLALGLTLTRDPERIAAMFQDC